MIVGDEIYVYYEGFDGTSKGIFLLTTDLSGSFRDKPLEPVLWPTNVPDTSSSIARPAVIYEPDVDPAWPFKMIFNRAITGTNYTSLEAARSKDGYTWTVLGEILNTNPANGAQAWENTYLETTGRLVNDDGVYRIFYSGHNGSKWQSGEAHSATFSAGIWERNSHNPLLVSRGGFKVPITADVVAGTKTVKVANSALFDVGAPIILWYGPTNGFHFNTVAAIPDGTTLTMRDVWQGGYQSAGPSYVSQIHSRSIELCDVRKEDGLWKAILTCFQFHDGLLVETTGYAETADLDAGFTVLPAVWPLPLTPKLNTWDQASVENLKCVKVL